MREEYQRAVLLEENCKLKDKIRQLTEVNQVTGLYSRDMFCKAARGMIEDNPSVCYEMISIDVGWFRIKHEVYGQKEKNRFLRRTAESIADALEGIQKIYGSVRDDVFIICVPVDKEEAVVKTILDIFRDPSMTISSMPGLGIYHIADPGMDVSSMCDKAVIALHCIEEYGSHVALYREDMRDNLLQEQDLVRRMDYGIWNKEFVVHLQPKCNITSGKIVGAEALVRWQHPEKGLLMPGRFIPVFEKNGLIERLDAYVWEETAAWLRRWMDAGHECVPVSVNLSKVDIYKTDVVQVLRDIMERYRLTPDMIELEITESTYTQHMEKVIQTTEQLSRYGFKILMDDFGSGYSSLNMLSGINIDILKIDMRFLDRTDNKSLGILESVFHMSRWLNIPVVAEGVEYEEQMELIKEAGCIYVQGYYYYMPVTLEEFERLLLDPKRVDYHDGGRCVTGVRHLLNLRDLFHKDELSDRLLENITGAVVQYAYDGRHLKAIRANKEYYRISGFAEEQISDEEDKLLRIIPEDADRFKKALERARATGGNEKVEVYVRERKTDRIYWYRIRLFYLTSGLEGDIYYASVSDETERMEHVERLRISEERFRLAMEAVNTVIFEVDVDKREARYSEYVQKKFGLDNVVTGAPEGFIGQGVVVEESWGDFRNLYYAIYRGAKCSSGIIKMRMGNGEAVSAKVTLTAIKDESGKTVKAVGIVEDLHT